MGYVFECYTHQASCLGGLEDWRWALLRHSGHVRRNLLGRLSFERAFHRWQVHR